MTQRIRYCVDCGWRIRDVSHEDPSALMITHAIETGHDLAADNVPDDRLTLRSPTG